MKKNFHLPNSLLLLLFILAACSKNDHEMPAAASIVNPDMVSQSSSKTKIKTQIYKDDLNIALEGWRLLGYCLGEEYIILTGYHRSKVHRIIYPDFSMKEVVHVVQTGSAVGASGQEYAFHAVSAERVTSKRLGPCTLYFEYHINYQLLAKGTKTNLYLKVHTTGYFDVCTQTNYGIETRISEICR